MWRFHLLLFGISVVVLSWLGMVAVHELGHVVGARATGGTVLRVVLHPMAIAHTEVSPNPSPGVVAWMGPLVGIVLPVSVAWLVRNQGKLGKVFAFFAGFCLIANGTYIALGSFQGVGDCGQMYRTGTPQFAMLLFGILTVPAGIYVWHRLGSLRESFRESVGVSPLVVYTTVGILLMLVIIETAVSSY